MGVGLWVSARALGVVRLSRKIRGNSRARRKILGIIGREFWEFCDFCIIIAGAPITGLKRGRRRSGDHEHRASEGQRRTAKGGHQAMDGTGRERGPGRP